MKKATLYIVILGILCLGAGVAIGMLVEKERAKDEFYRMFKGPYSEHRGAGPWMEGKRGLHHKEGMKAGAGKFFERIGEKLGLTAEQKAKVEAILEGNKQQVKQARDGFKAQLEQVKESCHAQILEILKPEQKEKFEQMTSRMEERREKKSWR